MSRDFRHAILDRNDAAAFQVLGLHDQPDTYTVQAVDAAWRHLRSELHPDRPGGDAAKFNAAKKAYDAARFYALQPKPCPTCEGSGKVPAPDQRRASFAQPILIMCTTCYGSGHR